MKNKNIIIFFIGIIFGTFLIGMALAQGGFWIPDENDNLQPLSTSTGLRVDSLANCDTIDTNASGTFACGTDDAGPGADTDWIIVGTDMYATDTISNVGIGITTPQVGLHIGPTGTTHSLSSGNDLIVSGKLEVDGIAYFDNSAAFFSDINMYSNIVFQSSGKKIRTGGADGFSINIEAWDDDANAMVHVARIQSANDPYFSMGGSQEFKFYNSGTMNLKSNALVIDSNGNVGIGDSTPSYTLDVDGDIRSSGDLITQRLFTASSTSQILATNTTQIISTHSLLRLSGDADYVLSATPTIAAGTDGQFLIIRNVGTTTIDFQDNSILSGSEIFHEGTTCVLSPNETLTFLYVDAVGGWVIQSHPNLIAGADSSVGNVRNTSGSSIAAGKAIYLTGFNIGQDRATIDLADADDPSKMPAVGITTAVIANGANGTAVIFGVLRDVVDTSGFSVGDLLYVDTTAGEVTNVRPSIDSIQLIGIVTRSHASKGRIGVTGAGRSNDVPKIFEATKITVGTTTPTSGMFEVASSTSSFMFIDSNGNVGIGTITPEYKLDVAGSLGAFTLNTGQGDYELYQMNQNVHTFASPSFNGLTLTGDITFNDGAGRTIKVDNAAVGFAGDDLAIVAGRGASNQPGGDIYLSAGAGIGSGDGGDIIISAGNGSPDGILKFGDGLTYNFYIDTSGNVATGTWQGTPISILNYTDAATSGDLMAITDGVFSVNEGTMTNTKGCIYTSGTGLVCNSDFLTDIDMSSAQNNFVPGRSISTSTAGQVDADAETYVYKAKIAFENPVATDDFFFGEIAGYGVTFTSIYCKTLVGTVDFDIQIAGSDINGSDITCNTSGVLDSSLGGDTAGATGEELKLAITSVASSPTYLMVIINGTYDD